MFQSLVEGRAVPWDLLVKDVPAKHHHDLDYLLDMLDWEANIDPEFDEHRSSIRRPSARVGEWTSTATARSGSSTRRATIRRKN